MKRLTNKHIVLGITGGIAAYKSADLVRRLKEAGAKVRVVMTTSAKAFITPLTLQALSGHPVHDDLFDLAAEAAMGHIELARWADCIVIAPTSADFMAKLASGQGSDLLSTLCLATTAPIAIVPAMNQQMWHATATQSNLKLIQDKGISVWGPAAGSQACGDVGLGRMLEPNVILEYIASLFQSRLLEGLHILMTAGPTKENIDAVRYISNRSSGKMGFEIASACIEAGAKVTLVSGPVHLTTPEDVLRIDVQSALEMRDAVIKRVSQCDIFIAVAAVADYRCQHIATDKIAKSQPTLTLELIRNPDIIAEVAALTKRPFVVGFAAETQDLLKKAADKLSAKKLDMIVANPVGVEHHGFESDTNALTLLWQKGEHILPLASKAVLARQLITIIKERFDDEKKRTT